MIGNNGSELATRKNNAEEIDGIDIFANAQVPNNDILHTNAKE